MVDINFDVKMVYYFKDASVDLVIIWSCITVQDNKIKI